MRKHRENKGAHTVRMNVTGARWKLAGLRLMGSHEKGVFVMDPETHELVKVPTRITVDVPAVHDDSSMKSDFDWGLGCRVEGRSHRKALMKQMGLRECG